jgi:hypothetical protein
VARLVAAREAAGGGLPVRARRRPLVNPFAEKIDELVDRSPAQIRADKAHAIFVAMGYEGSYRTKRRAMAAAKQRRDPGRPARRQRRPLSYSDAAVWLRLPAWSSGVSV